MAKKIYVPVSNLSDEVKKILVSTGGLSDYAVKGYCSVNGLSKQFWGSGSLGPWPYKSAIQELLITFEQLNPGPYTPDYTFTKKYEGMSYYGIIKYKNSGDTEYYTAPILFSRTSNGTKVNEYNYQSKYFQVGTGGWYYGIPLSFTDNFMQQLRIDPECWLTDEKMDNQSQLENFLANFILTRIEPYEN